jgi:hypothetical protein
MRRVSDRPDDQGVYRQMRPYHVSSRLPIELKVKMPSFVTMTLCVLQHKPGMLHRFDGISPLSNGS